jgi:hypothetical protein
MRTKLTALTTNPCGPTKLVTRATTVRIVLLAILVLSIRCGEPLRACFGDEGDLDVLTRMRVLIDAEYYGGTFPGTPIGWADGPKEFYAFTLPTQEGSRGIYFVRPNFHHDWARNLDTMKHEMAHVAAGPGHRHDAVWAREYRRLQGRPFPIRFSEIRHARQTAGVRRE